MDDDLEIRILDDFADDAYGLWEFDWGLNSMGYPADPAKRINLLIHLVEKGWIDIFFGRLGSADSAPLDRDKAIAAVRSLDHWQPRGSPEQHVYSLQTSPAGEARIKAGNAR